MAGQFFRAPNVCANSLLAKHKVTYNAVGVYNNSTFSYLATDTYFEAGIYTTDSLSLTGGLASTGKFSVNSDCSVQWVNAPPGMF